MRGAIYLILFLTGATLLAQDGDDFLDDLDAGDSLQERIDLAEDEAEKEKIVAAAVEQVLETQTGLPGLLALMAAEPDLFPPQRIEALWSFIRGHGKCDDCAVAIQKLLSCDRPVWSPSDTNVANFGVRVAFLFGDGSLLRSLLELLKNSSIDQEWLLLALGRAGGPKALKAINRFRKDESIIPLGNHQNIRAVPCAAIAGAAYAGDQSAREMLLEFYEQDTVNLPRFSFYVSWGIMDGQPAAAIRQAKRLRDYCAHRIWLAEVYLDSQTGSDLEALVARATGTNSRSLTSYLVKRLERSPESVRSYWGLLDHACIVVKERVSEALQGTNDPEIGPELRSKIKEFLSSPYGIERAFAVEELMDLDPVRGRELAGEFLKTEPNDLVREKIVRLLRQTRSPE